MLALLAGMLFAVAVLISRLPVAECPQCAHCRIVKDEERRRKRAAEDAFLRRYGMHPDDDEDRKH